MDSQEVNTYIIEQFSKFRPEKEIIKDLCERWDFTWPQAEQYLEKVKQTHSSKIRGRQAPLLVIIGLGTALLGLAALVITIYETLDGLVLIVAGVPWLGNLGWLVMSIAAILGGAYGTWKALS